MKNRNIGIIIMFICMIVVLLLELALYGYLLAEIQMLLESYSNTFIVPALVVMSVCIILSALLVIYVGKQAYKLNKR